MSAVTVTVRASPMPDDDHAGQRDGHRRADGDAQQDQAQHAGGHVQPGPDLRDPRRPAREREPGGQEGHPDGVAGAADLRGRRQGGEPIRPGDAHLPRSPGPVRISRSVPCGPGRPRGRGPRAGGLRSGVTQGATTARGPRRWRRCRRGRRRRAWPGPRRRPRPGPGCGSPGGR